MDGWIKLHRQISKWEWYKDTNTKAVFLHMLLFASYEPGRYMGYEIKPGDFVCGLNSLSDSLGISVRAVRTAIKHLISTHEIIVKTTNRFSIITLCNYSRYQQPESDYDRMAARRRHTDGTQSTTIKNIKNTENKKVNTYGSGKNVFLSDEEYRRLIEFKGIDLTESAIEFLSLYKVEKDYKTKCDYLTIRRWVFGAVDKAGNKALDGVRYGTVL